MKRFWLVLLSLGLIMAFSVSAYAVDVKVSGSMYVAGAYLDKINLNDVAGVDSQSTAFYFQRLRLTTEFVVSPGLSLITRTDVMERVWGASRTAPSTTLQTASAETTAENENIAFDYAYIRYSTPVGTFQFGSMAGGAIGTVFNDTTSPAWRLWYKSPTFANNFAVLAVVQKTNDNSFTASNATATEADKDNDLYMAGLLYNTQSINAGLAGFYYNYSSDTNYKRKSYLVIPWVIANIGPVKVQAEIDYAFGKLKEYDNAVTPDVDLQSLAYWIDAVGTFGQFYIGGTFAYSQGQGTDANETNNSLTGGLDWSPTLIMWNEDRATWFGSLTSSANSGTYSNGAAATSFGTGMSNAYFFQLRGGVKPVDKLDICASISYAVADTTPEGYVADDYGWEIDLTGTYKITNNLSYMLGVGYLITGDYFKGANNNYDVANDYLVINKLTLTF